MFKTCFPSLKRGQQKDWFDVIALFRLLVLFDTLVVRHAWFTQICS